MRQLSANDIPALNEQAKQALLERLQYAAEVKSEFVMAVVMPFGLVTLMVLALLMVGYSPTPPSNEHQAILDGLMWAVAIAASGVFVWRGRRLLAAFRGFTNVSRQLRESGNDPSQLRPMDIVEALRPARSGKDGVKLPAEGVLGLQARRTVWRALLRAQIRTIGVPASMFALVGAVTLTVFELPPIQGKGACAIVKGVLYGGLGLALVPLLLTLAFYPRQADVDRDVARRRARGQTAVVVEEGGDRGKR
ncbi:MAG: hypothetical protein E6Q40_11445 [Cupriavidus sp.]|nr:MAG: hypothetical protein E6Q40_11445 [Cupriavidus sp.]